MMPMVSKIIARIDIPFANNVVEALHKKFKNEFLQCKAFGNYHELSEALPGLIEKYNNQYHDSLFGYSPLEVWNGAMPAKESFKEVFQISFPATSLANTIARQDVVGKENTISANIF